MCPATTFARVRAIEALPLDGKPQLLADLIHEEEPMRRYEERTPMNRTYGKNGGPSTRALVGEIGGQLLQLAQTEVELARAELASDMRAGRRTLVGLAVATVAAIVGLSLLLVAVVLALITFMPGWLAALIVATLVLGIGGMAGYIGWKHRPRSPLALTRKSLKEDWEWLKEQVA